MDAALALARRALGRVAPNPAVGCLIVSPQGDVIARGWTAPGGRPHAETQALARAGEAARGATAYVTLEPCAHQGRTGPCAQALISAGVARAVSAVEDPDPRVAGRGHAMLRAAGIAVTEGVRAQEAAALNAGFLSRIQRGRPHVTLKLATSLDGAIALASGASRWITGESARAFGHLLRARADAILIGAGTALADDPELTCRLPGCLDRSPVRIIADSRGRLPLTARLVRSAKQAPVWLMTRPDLPSARDAAFASAGVRVLHVHAPAHHGEGVDMAEALGLLGREGITRVLVEGGAGLAASLIRAGLADEIVWMRAGIALGADARSAIAPLGLTALDRAPRYRLAESRDLGGDAVDFWVRAS